MESTHPCPLAVDFASHVRDARNELTERCVERIAARARLPTDPALPTEELFDHLPVLLDGIADFIEDPTDEIPGDVRMIAQAVELGRLRFSRGSDAAEILKEYEIIGGVLYSFAARIAAASETPSRPEDLITCSQRIFRALSVLGQVTTRQQLSVLGERVADREERLRRFSRMITHELKNRVGATLGAGQLLREEWLGTEERQRFAGMVEENAHAIQTALENLSALARIDGERRRPRNAPLSDVVRDVFRQTRELARARDVELRIEGELPDIEVNAAAVALCLSNYLSNAIRYSDAAAAPRWAEVSATIEDSSDASGEQLTVRVRDNGLGVPLEARDRLFDRFFRAHKDVVRTEGTGLGLNLVRETAASLGGRAWAEFKGQTGSVFAFSLPTGHADQSGKSDVSGSAGAATGNGGRRTDGAQAKASD